MATCTIHIGMHKTGSSSIQKSLFAYAADERFAYARIGNRANHSLAIFSLFAANPERHQLHRRLGLDATGAAQYCADMRKKLLADLSNLGKRDYLISGEGIKMLAAEELDTMREFFAERFERTRIVAYVRAPASYIESDFQQRVKGGLGEFDLQQHYPNYQDRFQKFYSVFGAKNVTLWKFAPDAFPGNCVVQDFSARLGLNIPAERIIKSNESLSGDAVALLYAFRKYGKGFAVGRDATRRERELLALLVAIPGAKARFASHLIAPVIAAQHADIAWVESRMGEPFGETVEPRFGPEAITGEEDLLKCSSGGLQRFREIMQLDAGYSDAQLADPHLVARLIDEWQSKPSERTRRKSKTGESGALSSMRLVDDVVAANPRLQGMDKSLLEEFLSAALQGIGAQLDAAGPGLLHLEGLGTFRLRADEPDQRRANQASAVPVLRRSRRD